MKDITTKINENTTSETRIDEKEDSNYSIVRWWTNSNSLILYNGVSEKDGLTWKEAKEQLGSFTKAAESNKIYWASDQESFIYTHTMRSARGMQYTVCRYSIEYNYTNFRTWCKKNNYPHK